MPEKMMFSTILFDLDGTLTDPKDGITRCIQYALDQLGVMLPEAEQLEWCIGPPLRDSFSVLLDTIDKTLLDKALFHYRKRFAEKGMFENSIYPDVTSSLKIIKSAGQSIFLATAKPEVFAKQILDHFELTKYFDAVYGSELNGYLSDKGELIAHILETEGLNPEQTLMVGDRSHDIIGGKKNGLSTAWVSYGYGTEDECAASQPDLIFKTLSDLTFI